MKDLHIGCDPGLNGGFVALSAHLDAKPISAIKMPTMKVGGKPQLDTRGIIDWVFSLNATGNTYVWLEKCPKHSRSKSAMRSMAISYGRLIGIFEARFPHFYLARVAAGNELKGWQRQLLGKVQGEETKAKALELAQKLWPGYQWPANTKGAIWDGPIDAALLAHWGRGKTELAP